MKRRRDAGDLAWLAAIFVAAFLAARPASTQVTRVKVVTVSGNVTINGSANAKRISKRSPGR